jgi:hypothetical protein
MGREEKFCGVINIFLTNKIHRTMIYRNYQEPEISITYQYVRYYLY